MTEILSTEGSQFPTLMRTYDTDEDLDNYVIEHAYMFTIIQVRPGGFVNGHGSNYVREEVQVADHDNTEAALAQAMVRAAEIYALNKKNILIYAVANFAGAIGFNRPVRNFPVTNYKSKSDKARDERKAIAARKAERALKKQLKDKGKAKPKDPFTAAVFKTDFSKVQIVTDPNALTDEEFHATDQPLARLLFD